MKVSEKVSLDDILCSIEPTLSGIYSQSFKTMFISYFTSCWIRKFFLWLSSKNFKLERNQIMNKVFSHHRAIHLSNSRESPATLFTVEDEVEKAFHRKKSFFNKKASKSSILTVSKNQWKFCLNYEKHNIVWTWLV